MGQPGLVCSVSLRSVLSDHHLPLWIRACDTALVCDVELAACTATQCILETAHYLP